MTFVISLYSYSIRLICFMVILPWPWSHLVCHEYFSEQSHYGATLLTPKIKPHLLMFMSNLGDKGARCPQTSTLAWSTFCFIEEYES